MSRRESIYLDLVRSLAALAVVLDHAAGLFRLPCYPFWGHQSVMVFFVLSGYVICYVADTRETTPRAFVVARLARLWSVLVFCREGEREGEGEELGLVIRKGQREREGEREREEER